MSQICFIITDTQHKVYYACANAERIFNLPQDKIRNHLWFEHLSSEPELSKTLVLHDLKEQGYFNGFVGFSNLSDMYFCDYGKRYDVNGNHTGYDLVLTSTNSETAQYVKNFYQGIVERLAQNPNTPAEQVYEQEKASVEQNVGTEFSEFLLAILEQDED